MGMVGRVSRLVLQSETARAFLGRTPLAFKKKEKEATTNLLPLSHASKTISFGAPDGAMKREEDARSRRTILCDS